MVGASLLGAGLEGNTVNSEMCDHPRCVALRVAGSIFCTVHQNTTIRMPGDVAIRCTACARPIQIGDRWVVRAEGAFHSSHRCLSRTPDAYVPFVHRPRPARRGVAA